MKTLVTGANGFVGSHVVRALSAADVDVTGAVRSSTGADSEEIIFSDAADLSRHVGNFDAVVHTAGAAHLSNSSSPESLELYTEANVNFTSGLARAVAESERSRVLIHISSIAASGYTQTEQPITEDSPIGPSLSGYGDSKIAAEKSVLSIQESGRFGINLRPPLIYGSGARGNWAKLQKLADSGLPLPFAGVRNERSFLGIDNLTDLVCHMLKGREELLSSGTFNIADSGTYSLPEVVSELRRANGNSSRLFSVSPGFLEMTLKLLGKSSLVDGLLADLVLDTSKLEKTFSWSPPLSTPEGIRNSVT